MSLIIAGHWLGIHVPVATNTRKSEELLDMSFSMWPMLQQGKVFFIARQLLIKCVPAAMNAHPTIEELLEASFSMQSVSYQRIVGNYFFPGLFISYKIRKSLP
jgi:hypothetical protein